MGSWLTCRCGALLHTNLFCGTGIALIASEDLLDQPQEGKTAEDFIGELIVVAPKLLSCRSCRSIVILTYHHEQPQIRSYLPET